MSTPPPLPSGPPPQIEASLTAVVIREYSPMEQNHIPLTVGDTIKVTDFGEKLFWTGTLSNGAKGVFPASHVEIRGRGRGRGGLTRGVTGGRGGDSGERGRGGVRHSSYVPSNSGTTSPQQSNQNSRAKSGYSSNPLVEEPTRQPPPPINPRSSPIARLHGSAENIPSNGAPSPTPVRVINDNHNAPSPPTPIRGAVRGRGYRGLSQSSPNTNSLSAKAEVPVTPPVPEVPNNNNNNNNNNVDNNNNNNSNEVSNNNSNPNLNQEGGQKKKTREDLRKDTLQELYLTEKTYIEDLETLINVFIFPLKTMGVLPDATLYNIFSNVEVLINCNREMLKALEEKMNGVSGNEEVSIGACFTMLADYFKMYKVYCSNQSTSLTTVDTQTKKNPQFKKNLDICHSDPRCKGLFLQSFLIKPIQRVCKYPLLLRELIRYTPEDHPDYEPLQSAFAKINAVVTNINEAQREYEGLQRILDLQKLIDGIETLVEPGRRFHKEGELTFYKSIKSKHGEKRHVFFFSDLILLTTKKGNNKYEHKLSIPLGNCTLIVLADSDYIKNAFELSQKQLKKPCILSGDSPEELNTWTREIKNLIKMYQKKEIELKKKGFSTADD